MDTTSTAGDRSTGVAPQRYRVASAEVEAIQWDGTAAAAKTVTDWVLSLGGAAGFHCGHDMGCPGTPELHSIGLRGLSGMVQVMPGDWVVRGTTGEFFRWPAVTFVDNYRPIDDYAATEERIGLGLGQIHVGNMDDVRLAYERQSKNATVPEPPASITWDDDTRPMYILRWADEHGITARFIGYDEGHQLRRTSEDGASFIVVEHPDDPNPHRLDRGDTITASGPRGWVISRSEGKPAGRGPLESIHWGGGRDDATGVINWVIARGGTARYVGANESHHLRWSTSEHDYLRFIAVDVPHGTHRVDPGDTLIYVPTGDRFNAAVVRGNEPVSAEAQPAEAPPVVHAPRAVLDQVRHVNVYDAGPNLSAAILEQQQLGNVIAALACTSDSLDLVGNHDIEEAAAWIREKITEIITEGSQR